MSNNECSDAKEEMMNRENFSSKEIWESFFMSLGNQAPVFILNIHKLKGAYEECVKENDIEGMNGILQNLKNMDTSMYADITIESLESALQKTSEYGEKYLKEYEDDPEKFARICEIAKAIQARFIELIGGAKRPRRKKVVDAFDKIFEEWSILQQTPAVDKFESAGLPEEETTDKLDMVREKERGFQKELMKILSKSYENGELDYRALYARPELWFTVVNSPNYISLRKGLGILKQNLPEIIEIACGDKEKAKLFDMGVGGGQKGEEIIKNFVEAGKKIDYVAVDSVPFMLNDGTVTIVRDLLHGIIEKAGTSEAEKSAWKPLLELVDANNLTYSQNQALHRVLDRIFYKFADTTRDVSKTDYNPAFDYTKHLIARMLSLHKGRKSQKGIMDKLDNMQLPLEVIPKFASIEDIDKSEFLPRKNEAVVSFDLGCRVCNQNPSKTIPGCLKYLNEPIPPKDINGPIPLEREKEVEATYAVIGFQPSHFDSSHPNFTKEAQSIKEGYKSDEFLEFLTNPFRLECSKYYVNGKEFDFIELFETPVIDLSSEQKQLEEYIQTFTGNEIQAEVNSSTDIQGEQSVDKTVADDFQKSFNEIRNNLQKNISLDEKKKLVNDFLEQDSTEKWMEHLHETAQNSNSFLMPKFRSFVKKWHTPILEVRTAYEKDPEDKKSNLNRIAHYLHYNTDVTVNIGKKTFFQKKDEEMLLHVSYKPTMEQMKGLFEANGIKIIQKYTDNPKCPKYAKFLVRRKTPQEL